ncbi:MAG: hypothetical protein QN171_06930, partial [Armatimonadota bacterium]|nr:hypothetical protein [Armatimonadota bacterium]
MGAGTVTATGVASRAGSSLRPTFVVCVAALVAAAGLAYRAGGVDGVLPVAALGVALLTAAVMVDYRLGVWMLPFAILLSPEFGAGVVRLRVEDVLLPLVLLGWVVHVAGTREGWARTPVSGLVLVLLLSGLVSTSLGILRGTMPQPPLGFFFLFKRIEYLLLFFLALQVARDRRWGRWMVA